MTAVFPSPRVIERKAEELLKHITNPPVPVHIVAGALGLDIESADLGEGISGVLVVQGDRGVIGVNEDHPFVRQRFTIAHECGHFVLHRTHGSLFIDKKFRAFFRDEISGHGTDLDERVANAFAAALLMPERMVKRAATKYVFELGDEDGPITELARSFQVSTQAMTYRLVNLGILGPSQL